MKIIGMIPARLGSSRIKNKNLRILNNKPLIQHIIDAAKNSKFLNELYLNSESLIFKEISKDSKINFYHRPKELSSDKATNDDFTIDFLNKHECDLLIQLLPTSPFISSENIDEFIEKMINNSYDTMISLVRVQIETIYKNNPINFDQKKQTPPSQILEPIFPYACGIMGWKTLNFKKNITEFGAAYHGGNGKVGFYELKGFSNIDIDNEEDFLLAECVSEAIGRKNIKPTYYNKSQNLIFDSDVKKILSMDGVKKSQLLDFNKEVVSMRKIIEKNNKNQSWSHTLINSKSNSATLIAQMPGEGNRMHFHLNWDEWWYILQGQWEWVIESNKKIISKDDVIFIERKKKHKITAIGNELAIRLAVSRYDVDHVYTKEDF